MLMSCPGCASAIPCQLVPCLRNMYVAPRFPRPGVLPPRVQFLACILRMGSPICPTNEIVCFAVHIST